MARNKWINKPTKKIVNINTGNVQLKAADFMNAIEDLEDHMDEENFIKKYETLKDKVRKYRQTGLDTGGEYSTENLVFKILRNTGYLGRMVDIKNEYLTQELSLDEILDSDK